MDNQGKNFQRAVARWLQKALKLKHIEFEKLAQGRNGRYYADIYAQERRPYICWLLLALGLLVLGAILLGSAVWLQWGRGSLPDDVRAYLPSEGFTATAFGIGSLICVVASLPLMWIGRRRRRHPHRNVWVECKDLHGSAPKADVGKLVGDVGDVLGNDGANWHPDVVMMVARNGYAKDGLRVTTDPEYRTVRQCEIRLYRQRGKTPNAFELVLFQR